MQERNELPPVQPEQNFSLDSKTLLKALETYVLDNDIKNPETQLLFRACRGAEVVTITFGILARVFGQDVPSQILSDILLGSGAVTEVVHALGKQVIRRIDKLHENPPTIE